MFFRIAALQLGMAKEMSKAAIVTVKAIVENNSMIRTEIGIYIRGIPG